MDGIIKRLCILFIRLGFIFVLIIFLIGMMSGLIIGIPYWVITGRSWFRDWENLCNKYPIDYTFGGNWDD